MSNHIFFNEALESSEDDENDENELTVEPELTEPCSEIFHGTEPFSEPETRAMRDWVLFNKKDLKFVVNYHCFGNLLLYPYSGTDVALQLTDEQQAIYDDIKEAVTLPNKGMAGSVADLLGYRSDGEASDWMLHKAGVIAMSPELASDSITSMTFDIASVHEEAQIIL